MMIPEPADRPAAPRRRNAADSRRALLEAARDLFAERGFERSTIRDIGERAGLDPTLIARYFGSKAALYLEALRADFADEGPGALPDLLTDPRMRTLLDRAGTRGISPIYETALRRQPDAAVEAEAREVLNARLVAPMRRAIDRTGLTDDGELRAELITAAFIGVAVGRQSGAFPALTGAPPEQVAELLIGALRTLVD
jgi:AcrR family transcriptional regulator